jgi:hypothetical protein
MTVFLLSMPVDASQMPNVTIQYTVDATGIGRKAILKHIREHNVDVDERGRLPFSELLILLSSPLSASRRKKKAAKTKAP